MTRRPRSGTPEYELSAAAERDLLEIARHPIETWGIEQAKRYETALETCFTAIGRGATHGRRILEHRPELLVTHCEHHFAFFLRREGALPLILAVFHESMDLITRLRDRLHPGGEPTSE